MFNNLTLFQIAGEFPETADQLENFLAKEKFVACAATQAKSTGWVGPRDQEHGALVELIAGQQIACFVIETKNVPGAILLKRTDELAARITEIRGIPPGKKELRDLRDEALLALLPQAFPRNVHISVWISRELNLLVIDTAVQSKADEVVSSLVRVLPPGFQINLVQTRKSPVAAMTDWLTADDPKELSTVFAVERECELKSTGDEPARVRFDQHNLEIQEVHHHIAEGKLPTKLALSWKGRCSFMLTQTLGLRKVTFDFSANVPKEDEEEQADRFDTEVTLVTGDLSLLLRDLFDVLDGLDEEGSGHES